MHDEDDRAAQRLQAAAAIDREDLLAILTLRFGIVPAAVRERIEACHNLETLERLVLVAANVPTWEVFLGELDGKGDDFKVVGERFDPLSALSSSHASGRPPDDGRPPDAPTSGERDGVALSPETYLIQIAPRSKEH